MVLPLLPPLVCVYNIYPTVGDDRYSGGVISFSEESDEDVILFVTYNIYINLTVDENNIK